MESFCAKVTRAISAHRVWIGVGNVEVLLEELRAKGAKVRNLPQNYDWAYEMQIEDLDGNVLRIGSDTRPAKPAGNWLDMHGRVWKRTADGGWETEKRSNHRISTKLST